jgi:hypothetical protein
MTKKELRQFIDESLMHDIDNAINHAYDLDFKLDEKWLYGITSDYFKDHYENHVLQPQKGEKWTEFPGRSKDGEYRIKMPPMTREEYEAKADELALTPNVYPHTDKTHNFIGGIAYTLKDNIRREAYVKIRRHSQYIIDSKFTVSGESENLNRMSEIVVYKKAPDGSNLIITYMLARNIINAIFNFRWIGDLPESETKDTREPTYYLVVDNYATVGGDKYFETVKFTSYPEASKYFSSNKKSFQLIKVETGIKKMQSQKNPANIIPEIKNKDGRINNLQEAIQFLNKNNFNK